MCDLYLYVPTTAALYCLRFRDTNLFDVPNELWYYPDHILSATGSILFLLGLWSSPAGLGSSGAYRRCIERGESGVVEPPVMCIRLCALSLIPIHVIDKYKTPVPIRDVSSCTTYKKVKIAINKFGIKSSIFLQL